MISATPLRGTVPLRVDFHGMDSRGVAADATFRWSLGTGEPDHVGRLGSHTYQHAGSYTLTLTVESGGEVVTASATITVEPAVWVTDKNLAKVFRLNLAGEPLDEVDVPSSQPTGVTLVQTGGGLRLIVACEGGGQQRIWMIDPEGDAASIEYSAQGQLPRNLTFGRDEPERIWHTDGLARRIYGLNLSALQRVEAFGNNYFPDANFLYAPAGLSWTPGPGSRSG